jgi:hypothetical protein
MSYNNLLTEPHYANTTKINIFTKKIRIMIETLINLYVLIIPSLAFFFGVYIGGKNK